MSRLSYDDFKNRLSIQEVLIDAGYTHYKRDGLRYPSYVRLDSDGRRIPGDKFIVTANGLCCFQPPVQKNYNVISFIKEHPDLFSDYTPGMDKDRLVNLVCNRLLNQPVEERETKIINTKQNQQPFDINQYKVTEFKGGKDGNFRQFYPYFAQRGIDLPTQSAFKNGFVIASMQGSNGKTYSNLSFPMRIPNKEGIVGLEQRGLKQKDGTSYKGMARGSNASEGMWITSPRNTPLSEAKRVIVFESAYDAMAFYQMLTCKDSNLDQQSKDELKSAVYVSTGGNPSYGQMQGLIKNAPNATFHLGFDNDMAGRQFEKNFRDIAYKQSLRTMYHRTCDHSSRLSREKSTPLIRSAESKKSSPMNFLKTSKPSITNTHLPGMKQWKPIIPLSSAKKTKKMLPTRWTKPLRPSRQHFSRG